jgi:hypothetical protein
MVDSEAVVVGFNTKEWGGNPTLPCTEVKLPIGDWNRNRRAQERSFRVRDAVMGLKNMIDLHSEHGGTVPLTNR